jgi:RNA polymerase sigma-70 factor (ECF subfamily)
LRSPYCAASTFTRPRLAAACNARPRTGHIPIQEASIERPERFEQLYRCYEQGLLGYALRRAPVEVAKDAVADTFLAAWRRLDELPADPLPWLIGTTRKTLANQRRSLVRQERVTERLAREPATDGSDEDVGFVRAALERLTPAERETLTLVAWDELTPTQAARSLGCSPVAFRVRLHRARRRLASALHDAGENTDWVKHTPEVKEVS